MKLSTRQQGDVTILDLIGEITLLNSPEIRKAVLGLLREKRVPHLILNMQGLAQNLKELGQGRAWLVATGQQTLAEAVDELE